MISAVLFWYLKLDLPHWCRLCQLWGNNYCRLWGNSCCQLWGNSCCQLWGNNCCRLSGKKLCQLPGMLLPSLSSTFDWRYGPWLINRFSTFKVQSIVATKKDSEDYAFHLITRLWHWLKRYRICSVVSEPRPIQRQTRNSLPYSLEGGAVTMLVSWRQCLSWRKRSPYYGWLWFQGYFSHQ
jgi:hypothetical protein